MVARGPGDVGCAHCTRIGADRPCAVCTHLVCETCAADWTTCSEPSGRVARLGLTARVRDIDPTGRLAFVTHWRQPPRLLDLRRLRWVRDVPLDRKLYLWNRGRLPRLTGDGRLIYFAWRANHDLSQNVLDFDGIRVGDLAAGTTRTVSFEVAGWDTAVSAVGDYFSYVTETQQVAIVRGTAAFAVEPLPRRVIQARYIDGDRDLLAASSWSEVVLCGLVDGKLAPIGHHKTETVGDVHWVAVAGPWLLAAVTKSGGGTVVEARPLERDLVIGPVAYRVATSELLAAAVSRDGRYLALAGEGELRVHELATGAVDSFTEHTDQINRVRFGRDDHVLISADRDNRVVLRPRTPTGYARPVIAIDVPDEGVELPSYEGSGQRQ